MSPTLLGMLSIVLKLHVYSRFVSPFSVGLGPHWTLGPLQLTLQVPNNCFYIAKLSIRRLYSRVTRNIGDV